MDEVAKLDDQNTKTAVTETPQDDEFLNTEQTPLNLDQDQNQGQNVDKDPTFDLNGSVSSIASSGVGGSSSRRSSSPLDFNNVNENRITREMHVEEYLS